MSFVRRRGARFKRKIVSRIGVARLESRKPNSESTSIWLNLSLPKQDAKILTPLSSIV